MPVAWSSSEIIRIRIQIWTQKFKYKDSSPLEIGKIRANIHLGGGGSNRVLPEWRRQIVCHQGEKNNNELLQCLFFVVVEYRNEYRVDGYVFRSVTQLFKQMCCLLPE